MQKIGLLEAAVRIGARTDRVVWYETGGDMLATLDYSVLDHPHNYLLTVVPSELEQMLRGEFSRNGGRLEEGIVFNEAALESSRVLVRAERNGAAVQYATKLIVGADGQDSRVRQALHLTSRVKECSADYLFMIVESINNWDREARQFLARGKMVGVFPTRGGAYIFYYAPKERLEHLRARGLDSFKKEIEETVPEVSGPLAKLQSWNDTVYARPKQIQVKCWTVDRVALLGDAAHAMDPSWAQGANTTLQDAVALVKTIEACFQTDDFSRNRLKVYEDSRRKQTSFIQSQANLTGRLTATENRFNYWLGKHIIKRTGRNRDLMRTALRASSGLTDHFTMLEQIRFII